MFTTTENFYCVNRNHRLFFILKLITQIDKHNVKHFQILHPCYITLSNIIDVLNYVQLCPKTHKITNNEWTYLQYVR